MKWMLNIEERNQFEEVVRNIINNLNKTVFKLYEMPTPKIVKVSAMETKYMYSSVVLYNGSKQQYDGFVPNWNFTISEKAVYMCQSDLIARIKHEMAHIVFFALNGQNRTHNVFFKRFCAHVDVDSKKKLTKEQEYRLHKNMEGGVRLIDIVGTTNNI